MKQVLTSILVLFLVNAGFTQTGKVCVPCLPDGITFPTQSQIDSFPVYYPGCTEIQGDVEIGGIWPGSGHSW